MQKFLAMVALAVVATPAFAALDMSSATTIPGVVDVCRVVASTETPDGNVNRGECINATEIFLESIKADQSTQDQQIADLIVLLVPLTQEDLECDGLDDEVARAILLASTYSSTEEQKLQLVQLSDTVAACVDTGTAAIPEGVDASPTE